MSSRPTTPLPQNAPRASEIAVDTNLPSRANSTELFDGHRLEIVQPHEKVHPGHEIIKDRKTGKHYKKVAPAWGLGHAKGGAPTTESHGSHAAKFSLGHGFGQRDPYTAGSKPMSKTGSQSGGHTPPVGVTSSLSAADVSALVERLRSVVREEVAAANHGHIDNVEKVVSEQLAQQAEVGAPGDPYQPASETSEKSKDTKNGVIMDPLEAERGLDDNNSTTSSELQFPNPWAKIRYQLREPFSEFLGCLVLLTFGDGINVQALFAAEYDPSTPRGNYLSVSFGWGIAVAMGVYVAGGVSGGHINPVVTLALAMFRGFPWKKVPIYIFAQILGGTVGALMIYGLYVNPIRAFDPMQTQTSAQYFTTFPASFIEPPGARITGWYNETYATAILLMVILAISDNSNTPPPDGMAPIVLLWLVTGIGATLGWQTAYAINPARDLGPRIALSIVGYRGLWTFNAWYWLRTPLLGALCGAPLGCLLYDLFIYTGDESPLNKPWKWSDVRWRPASKDKMPAGITRDGSRNA
ncbi:unnamed protein product [Jaminaea pallidilutea]